MVNKDSYISPISASEDLVTWDERYMVGIPLIDEQHKELVLLTNQLYRACFNGNEATVFPETMSRMVEYVRFHFGAELELLKRINYPDYSTHKNQHDTLVLKILEAVQEYKPGRKFVPNHFARTLKDWIFSHIAIYDKIYAAYVADQIKKGLLSHELING